MYVILCMVHHIMYILYTVPQNPIRTLSVMLYSNYKYSSKSSAVPVAYTKKSLCLLLRSNYVITVPGSNNILPGFFSLKKIKNAQ